MPAWPAADCVAIIDGVIVVNFGVMDIVFADDEAGASLLVRHFVSDGHAEHAYEYIWDIRRIDDGIWHETLKTTVDTPQFDIKSELAAIGDDTLGDSYYCSVAIRNVDLDYRYPAMAIEISLKE